MLTLKTFTIKQKNKEQIKKLSDNTNILGIWINIYP